jgi:hypothetical protein
MRKKYAQFRHKWIDGVLAFTASPFSTAPFTRMEAAISRPAGAVTFAAINSRVEPL